MKKTVMETAELKDFQVAKAMLDTKIEEAIIEFIGSLKGCKLIGVDIMMNGEDEGDITAIDGTVDKVRAIIEVD